MQNLCSLRLLTISSVFGRKFRSGKFANFQSFSSLLSLEFCVIQIEFFQDFSAIISRFFSSSHIVTYCLVVNGNLHFPLIRLQGWKGTKHIYGNDTNTSQRWHVEFIYLLKMRMLLTRVPIFILPTPAQSWMIACDKKETVFAECMLYEQSWGRIALLSTWNMRIN